MSAPLLLVGVVHHQPGGRQALLTELDQSGFDPARTWLGVEASSLSLVFRRTWSAELKDHLDRCLEALAPETGRTLRDLKADLRVRDLLNFLEPPFEYAAARLWAGPGRVRLTGDKALSQRELAQVWEMFSPANLRLVLTGPPPRPLDGPALARAVLSGRAPAPPTDQPSETRTARLLRLKALSRPVIHIGGWAHLPGLARRLADLAPAVRLAEPTVDRRAAI